MNIDQSPPNGQECMSGNRFRDDRIHLSNVDLSDDEYSPPNGGGASSLVTYTPPNGGESQYIIRSYMQPNKTIRQRESKNSAAMNGGMTTELHYSEVLLSVDRSNGDSSKVKDYNQISLAR